MSVVLFCIACGLLAWREKVYAKERLALREAEARFIAAAENSHDSFLICDSVRGTDGKIVDFTFRYANPAAEKLLGMKRGEVVGKKLCTFLPANLERGFFEKYCEVVRTGNAWEHEFQPYDPKIKAGWILTRITKLGDGFAATSTDRTAVKAAEARFLELARFSESIFENAPFSMMATDAAGTITAMNQAAERLTQYSRDELVGKASMLVLHDAEELGRRGRDLEMQLDIPVAGFEVLSTNPAKGLAEEREWNYLLKDGSRIAVSVALRAIRSAEGRDIEGYVCISEDVTDRRLMMTYVSHLATHDHLTGLAGRTLLRQRLTDAVDRARLLNKKVAVFVLDLDHFKRVNDSLGHQAGDQVIREAAQQLRAVVRASDTIGRMGADEFVVILPDIDSIEDINQFAQTLVQRMSRTITVHHHDMNLTASVGVCIYPDFASNADSLLERANAAMFESKQSGRDQFQIFNTAMLKESSTRLMMEHELRNALKNGELSLVYQPQVCLRTGEVVGLEALVRWENRRLGRVSPAEFIPLAEETGLIVPIGEWIFEQACKEGKQIGDAVGRELCVAINLSPRQFRQKNLLDVIKQSLSTSGLLANNLEIEITENTLMVNSAANLEMLQEFRELGGRIAIDDFGTGFCSFTYLLEYHVDRLKIDQSFIRRAATDPNAAAVVRTIIAMSHGLSIKVVAEGVETAEHLSFLQRRRCDEAQGYLFARPITAKEFPAAVEAIRRAQHHDRKEMTPERMQADRFMVMSSGNGAGAHAEDVEHDDERKLAAG